MALSDLLQRIKSALGIGRTRRRRPNQPAQQQGQPTQGHQQGQPTRDHQQEQPTQGQPAQEPSTQGHSSQAPSAQGQQADDGVNVTVEREPEPSTESEDAVKGTETADEPETTEADEPETTEADEPETTEADEPASAPTEPEDDESEAALGTDESVDVIKGIGATYAERLGGAGVETVADLATSDPGELAEKSDISEGRLENWIEKAKHR